jgi:hypothetical protein
MATTKEALDATIELIEAESKAGCWCSRLCKSPRGATLQEAVTALREADEAREKSVHTKRSH